jgi:hypothetical protein
MARRPGLAYPHHMKELAPEQHYEFRKGAGDVLVIACGALARELVALVEINGWRQLDIQCLPAIWHNTPERIPDGVRDAIHKARRTGRYREIFIAYGDCGTGGLLDKVIEAEGVARIDGPHCYSFFSGNEAWKGHEDEITAFYLTDYLARHFDTLVWKGFGLDRHPELKDMMFANYTKVVYLAQTEDHHLQDLARQAAAKLGLDYEYRFTGYGDLATALKPLA